MRHGGGLRGRGDSFLGHRLLGGADDALSLGSGRSLVRRLRFVRVVGGLWFGIWCAAGMVLFGMVRG